jgi:uncharacterized protein YwgA
MLPLAQIGDLILELGMIQGRKRFQKIVHILQSAGAPFSEHFELSHYGAYSAELKAELDMMKSQGLVEEMETSTRYGDVGFEIKPKPALGRFLSQLTNRLDSRWICLAKKLNEKPSSYLEGVSTVRYLRTQTKIRSCKLC